MSILNIQPAKRAGAKVVIGLAGNTGSGKTRTALEIAHGLTNYRPEKIGFLDTENGRGRLYSEVLGESFMHGDLRPPFSPKRYIMAIEEFEAAGVEVLIIDSGSHEWEGTGGCEEIAKAANPRKPNWILAKEEHKKFMNAMLASSMHIIICLRARDKTEVSNGPDGKLVYTSLGEQPICEKNVMFDMTASLHMWDEGQRQTPVKVPDALKPFLSRKTGYIGAKDGLGIREWIEGGEKVDRELQRQRASLATAATEGVKQLEAAWKALTPAARKALKPELDPFKESAKSFEKHRELAKDSGAGVAEDLNSALAGAPQDAPPELPPVETAVASTERGAEPKGETVASVSGDIFGG